MKLLPIFFMFILFSCSLGNTEKIKTPEYHIFTPLEIDIQTYPDFYKEKIDSILILTKDKLILMKGEYSVQNSDTIISPYSVNQITGFEFFTYENSSGSIDANTIEIFGKVFTKNKNFKFQWSDDLLKHYDKNEGLIIISGP